MGSEKEEKNYNHAILSTENSTTYIFSGYFSKFQV